MKYQRKPGTVLAGNNFEPSPDSFPPDSIYWMRRATAMGLLCRDIISNEELERLARANAEKEGSEERTWKDMFQFYRDVFNTAEQDADHADLLDTQRCAQ